MEKIVLKMTQDAQQANIPMKELARKILLYKGYNQSALKDLLIRYGKTPNPGIIAQAKQAGELIYNEAGAELPEILKLDPSAVPSKYRRFKFYNMLSECPSVFLSILAIYEDDKKNDKEEFIKVASFQGENSVNIPGGVVEDWRYAPGQALFGQTPQRTPMSISYFRGNWYPQIKNDYQKATGLQAPPIPGQGNLEQLYQAAEFIWKLDQAFIDNYSTIKNNWANKFKIIAPLANTYTYPYNNKGDFKVTRNRNILDRAKTNVPIFAIARGSFLLLVDNNVFNLATRLKAALQTDPAKLIKWWEANVGGDFSELEKMINQGSKKNPIFPGKKSSLDPGSLTIALTSATALIASVNDLLKGINGAKDELLAIGENPGRAGLPEIGNIETPWGNFSWGLTNNKAMIIYVGLAVAAIVGVFYFTRKK